MSSPTKFRAWSNEHNRYCDFVTFDVLGKWIGWIKSSGVYLTTADIILEQFTGLKDKNGKEIWVGDIVKCWDEDCGEVYFDTISLQYRVKFSDGDDEDLASSEPEVIGNVHENKELLGGEE